MSPHASVIKLYLIIVIPCISPEYPNTSPRFSLSSSGLCDEGGSGSGLVFEGGWDLLGFDVVSGETVDSGLDENHSAKGETRVRLGVVGIGGGSHNLASLSARFRSRCFRTATAFLIKWYMSSGMDGARPDHRISTLPSLPTCMHPPSPNPVLHSLPDCISNPIQRL
jgi:hypothetical protein